MPWSNPSSRLALIRRRLRGRFGISAPQVSVQTQVPWYLRLLAITIAVLVIIALAGWAYNAGRRVAGFDQGETSQILAELRKQNGHLEEEVVRLRSLLTASESNLQIERAAQQLLSERQGALVQENNKLREEIAVFEKLTKFEARQDEDVTLEQVMVRPDAQKGSYRYSFLIGLQGARRGKDAKFNLQFQIAQRGERSGAKIIVPQRENAAEAGQFEIMLRNFRRIEGKFSLPSGVVPAAVEIRILEAGKLKASHSVTFDK